MTMRPSPGYITKGPGEKSKWEIVFSILSILYSLFVLGIWIMGIIWAGNAATADNWDPQNFAHGLFYMLLGGLALIMLDDR